MRRSRHLYMCPMWPQCRWVLVLVLLLLHMLVLSTAAVGHQASAQNQAHLLAKVTEACLRLKRYSEVHAPLWTKSLENQFQELCEGTRNTRALQQTLANVEKAITNVELMTLVDSNAAATPTPQIAGTIPPAALSATFVDVASSSMNRSSAMASADSVDSSASLQSQGGSCPTLQAKPSTTLVALGTYVKLKFTLSNPRPSHTGDSYAYALRVDIPSGVGFVAAKAFPPIKNMRFQPKAGGGMVVWEITPIPASMAYVGLTLDFAVDGCRNSSAPLQFTASGAQVVNGAPRCPEQPFIPEIAVYQDRKKPAKGCNSSSISSLASIAAAVRVPAFRSHGPEGTRCIEIGTPSNLADPTPDDCFTYCSLLRPEEPSYMNYLDSGRGQPQCSCLGRSCTLGVIRSDVGTSRRVSRRLKHIVAAARKKGDSEGKMAERAGDGQDNQEQDGLLGTNMNTETHQQRQLEGLRFGAYEITALATRSPTSAPTSAPDCYIPNVFTQNMADCEKQLCDPLNWVEGLILSNATSNPTAYDVCSAACSVEALGRLPANWTSPHNTTLDKQSGQDLRTRAALDEQREWCRERCDDKGLDSFLCRRYCKDFPDDPVCPKPDCKTFTSIEASPEYCDRKFCLKFLPWDPFRPTTPDEIQQQEVCNLACSAQRLGPAGGLDTIIMRGHCQRLCSLSGPEGSRHCLSYCQSFPDDPACPGTHVIEGLMARSRSPTPSPTPPVFQQPPTPLLFGSLTNASGTPPPPVPVLSINQLALGYNPFLGLEPHEQLGIYTRNEIFQFHLDPENVFLVQAPNPNLQPSTVARFLAPLEYYVTPALADCSYSTQESSTISKSRDAYLKKTWSSKSMGLADIKLSGSVSGEVMPGVKAQVGAETTLNAAVGNSKEAQTGRNYEAQGLTKSTTTRLKRAYYKAGLRIDRLTKESFTPAFRSDSRDLAHRSYNFTSTMDFITKYGAYVFDGATMGASLYRSFFFSDDTDDGAITDIQQQESFADYNLLLSSKKRKGSRTEEESSDGTQVTFSYTDVERIGEFNTGGPSMDSTSEANSCAIGATISPQMIEYALKPLWDPQIPLELFMTKEEAINFRGYLLNATVTQLKSGDSCVDEFGDCYGNGGICLPKYDADGGAYQYVCENPARAGKSGTFEFDVYVFGLGISNYYGKKNGYPDWWGHHTPSLNNKIRQQGIFGYNMADVYNRDEKLGSLCGVTGSNFWNGFDYRLNETNPPGANPICPNVTTDKFTITPPQRSGMTQVRIDLFSMATRGIATDEYWHTFQVNSGWKEGFKSFRAVNHDVEAYYYAQPSMGVVVCPVLFENNTKIVEEYCYYVFRWAGAWSRPQQHFEKNKDETKDGLGFVAQLLASPNDFPIEIGSGSKEKDLFDNYFLYAVTTAAEPDIRFVTLSFDVYRNSDKPINIQSVINRVGVGEEPVPEMRGNYMRIKFTDLQAKLAAGLNTTLT